VAGGLAALPCGPGDAAAFAGAACANTGEGETVSATRAAPASTVM